jgi:hypothetical protein
LGVARRRRVGTSIEEEFDVQITDERAENIITVADAIRFLLKRKYGLRDEELPET